MAEAVRFIVHTNAVLLNLLLTRQREYHERMLTLSITFYGSNLGASGC